MAYTPNDNTKGQLVSLLLGLVAYILTVIYLMLVKGF